MRTILKNIVSSVVFVAILIGLLCISSLVFQPKSNSKADGIHNSSAYGVLSEPKDSIDALFLGDSEVYHAFIPLRIWKEYGITTYDCSTPNQKLVYSLEFLRKTFKQQSPKIVFLETNEMYRNTYFEDELTYTIEDMMPVFRYHDRWKNLQFKDFYSSVDYNSNERNKGYRFIKDVKPAKLKDYMKYSKVSAPIQSINEKYVRQIKKFCDENNTKLIFLSTPSPKNWNYQRHNSVEALAKELHVDYIDMNLLRDEIPIDWKKDTKDKGDHLNYYGAVKATDYMGNYLKNTKLFKDKSNDKNYSKWDKDLKKFEKKVKKEIGEL